jgi:hypothetical protein
MRHTYNVECAYDTNSRQTVSKVVPQYGCSRYTRVGLPGEHVDLALVHAQLADIRLVYTTRARK